MKVLSVVGNRPQFIKAAPLSVALRAAGLDEVVVHTGQHWDDELSRVFFEELALGEPAYRLDLRTADVRAMQPAILAAVGAEAPDWVLVYGDTNSTAAGGRAGAEAIAPSRRASAAALPCRGATGSRSTGSPRSCSAPTSAPRRRCGPRGSQAGSRSSAT